MTYSTTKLHRLQQSRAVMVTPSVRRPVAPFPVRSAKATKDKPINPPRRNIPVGAHSRLNGNQLSVLREMAKGGTISNSLRYPTPVLYARNDGKQMTEAWDRAPVTTLARLGYITRAEPDFMGDNVWRITEKGRKAVQR